MRTDEIPGEAALLVHVSVFTELRIKANFAEARDALRAADGVLVEDVVIADPEFEREIRAQRDETVELDVITDCPGKAAKDNDGRGKGRELPGASISVRTPQDQPHQEKGKENAKSGICKKSDCPENGVGNPIQDFGPFRQLKSRPQNCGYKERGEGSVPDPFEG